MGMGWYSKTGCEKVDSGQLNRTGFNGGEIRVGAAGPKNETGLILEFFHERDGSRQRGEINGDAS